MQSICKHFISALVLFGVVGTANADCWEEAGREFSIAPELLYAIAEQESNLNPRAIGHNSNGSRDIGLMQVNTYHLPRLAKYGITEQSLLNDSCRALSLSNLVEIAGEAPAVKWVKQGPKWVEKDTLSEAALAKLQEETPEVELTRNRREGERVAESLRRQDDALRAHFERHFYRPQPKSK